MFNSSDNRNVLVQIYKNSKKVDWLNFPSKPQYVHFEKETLNLEGVAYQNKEQLKSWFYTKQQATLMTDSTSVSVYNFSELTPWSTLDTFFCFSVWCRLPMAIFYWHHITGFVLSRNLHLRYHKNISSAFDPQAVSTKNELSWRSFIKLACKHSKSKNFLIIRHFPSVYPQFCLPPNLSKNISKYDKEGSGQKQCCQIIKAEPSKES